MLTPVDKVIVPTLYDQVLLPTDEGYLAICPAAKVIQYSLHRFGIHYNLAAFVW